jgi:hypothetical protein
VARIYLDNNILSLPVLKTIISPPTGTQPSLEAVKQIIASADATNALQICFVPACGYRICAK